MAEDEQGTERQDSGKAPARARDGEFTPPLAEPAGARPASVPGSGVICSKCGVTVAPGYPKCPKCGAGLPVPPSPLSRISTARPEPVGGTTVAGDRNQTWMLGALAVVVILGGVAYMATTDEDRSPPLATARGALVAADATEPGPVEPAEVVETAEPAAEDVPLEAQEALGGDPDILIELRAQLQVAKLWSTVFVDPDDGEVIVVESDQCDDAEMGALVDRMRGILDEAGFAKVTCSSKFGATVFEKQWRKSAAEDNDLAGANGAE